LKGGDYLWLGFVGVAFVILVVVVVVAAAVDGE
jgi:hypothetical protein